MSSDRIEKEVVLRAPLERVWRAISDADEFGQWFGVRFDGPFVAGASVTGVITPTTVDEDVARAQEAACGQGGHLADRRDRAAAAAGFPLASVRGRAGADYSQEPTTLVEFTLTETDDGVLLRIVESGFDSHSGRASGVGVRGQQRGLGQADRTGAQVSGTQREGVSTPRPSSPRRRCSTRSAIPIVCASSRGCATADPVRRRKSRTVVPVSRQAATKHLLFLEAVGLVSSQRHGRERIWRIEPETAHRCE